MEDLLVAALGQRVHLLLDSIQRLREEKIRIGSGTGFIEEEERPPISFGDDLLGGEGGLEEVVVDGEGAVVDGGLEVAAGLRGVVGVEGGEGGKRGHQILAVRPRLQHLLQFPGQPRRQTHCHPKLNPNPILRNKFRVGGPSFSGRSLLSPLVRLRSSFFTRGLIVDADFGVDSMGVYWAKNPISKHENPSQPTLANLFSPGPA